MWKSKGLSKESTKPPARLDNSLGPGLTYINNANIWVKFYGSCLKQENITLNHKTYYTHKTHKNHYTVYEINL